MKKIRTRLQDITRRRELLRGFANSSSIIKTLNEDNSYLLSIIRKLQHALKTSAQNRHDLDDEPEHMYHARFDTCPEYDCLRNREALDELHKE